MTTPPAPRVAVPRPQPDEYAESYAPYIRALGDEDVVVRLERQADEIQRLVAALPPGKGEFAYAPGKWQLKEVIGHLCDGERVFAYRALSIARGATTPLPGFDENAWMAPGPFRGRPIADLAAEFAAVRATTLILVRNLPPDALARVGIANDKPVSVRALVAIMAGHVQHHLGVIRERYLKG